MAGSSGRLQRRSEGCGREVSGGHIVVGIL
jgi:hypothetical protein